MEALSLAIIIIGSAAYLSVHVMYVRQVYGSQETASAPLIDDFHSAASVQHWAEVYIGNSVLHSVSFDVFMTNPRGYTDALLWKANESDLDILPLLPVQAAVRDRLVREELQAAEEEAAKVRARNRLASKYQTVSNNSSTAMSIS